MSHIKTVSLSLVVLVAQGAHDSIKKDPLSTIFESEVGNLWQDLHEDDLKNAELGKTLVIHREANANNPKEDIGILCDDTLVDREEDRMLFKKCREIYRGFSPSRLFLGNKKKLRLVSFTSADNDLTWGMQPIENMLVYKGDGGLDKAAAHWKIRAKFMQLPVEDLLEDCAKAQRTHRELREEFVRKEEEFKEGERIKEFHRMLRKWTDGGDRIQAILNKEIKFPDKHCRVTCGKGAKCTINSVQLGFFAHVDHEGCALKGKAKGQCKVLIDWLSPPAGWKPEGSQQTTGSATGLGEE